jgi:hypothetical protein
MAVAAGEEQGFRPGMVAMSPTLGDRLNPHPHVHALVTRGGWTGSGEWVGVPYVSSSAAEQLFRHKVIRQLQRAGLLDEDLTRLRWEPGSETATYLPRAGHDGEQALNQAQQAEPLASGPDVHPPPPPA